MRKNVQFQVYIKIPYISCAFHCGIRYRIQQLLEVDGKTTRKDLGNFHIQSSSENVNISSKQGEEEKNQKQQNGWHVFNIGLIHNLYMLYMYIVECFIAFKEEEKNEANMWESWNVLLHSMTITARHDRSKLTSSCYLE